MYVYAEEVFICNYLLNAAIFVTVAAAMNKSCVKAFFAAGFCALYDVAAVVLDISNTFAVKFIVLMISSIIMTGMKNIYETAIASLIIMIAGFCAGGAVFALNCFEPEISDPFGAAAAIPFIKTLCGMSDGLLFFYFVFAVWRKNVRIKKKTVIKKIIGIDKPIRFLVDTGNLAKAPDGKSVIFVRKELFQLLSEESDQIKIDEIKADDLYNETHVCENYEKYIVGIKNKEFDRILWLAPIEINDRRFDGICAPETLEEGEYIWSN